MRNTISGASLGLFLVLTIAFPNSASSQEAQAPVPEPVIPKETPPDKVPGTPYAAPEKLPVLNSADPLATFKSLKTLAISWRGKYEEARRVNEELVNTNGLRVQIDGLKQTISQQEADLAATEDRSARLEGHVKEMAVKILNLESVNAELRKRFDRERLIKGIQNGIVCVGLLVATVTVIVLWRRLNRQRKRNAKVSGELADALDETARLEGQIGDARCEAESAAKVLASKYEEQIEKAGKALLDQLAENQRLEIELEAMQVRGVQKEPAPAMTDGTGATEPSAEEGPPTPEQVGAGADKE